MLKGQNKEWDKLSEAIQSVKSKIARRKFSFRLALSLCIAALLYFSFSAVYYLVHFSPYTSLTLVTALLLSALAGVIISFFAVVFPDPDKEVVLIIEKHFPELKDRLACSYEIAQMSYQEHKNNAAIFEAIISDAAECAKKIEFIKASRPETINKGYLAAGAALVVLLFSAIFFPGFSISAMTGFHLTAKIYSVNPGNIKVKAGTDVQVKLFAYIPLEGDILLKSRTTDGTKTLNETVLEKRGKNLFEGNMFNVENPLEYWCETPGLKTKKYKIGIILPLKITKTTLTCGYPKYMELSDKSIDGLGDISEFEGTHVKLNIETNKELAGAVIKLNNAQLKTELSGKKVSTAFTIVKDGTYSVKLLDTEGLEIEETIYSIKALEDKPPVVRVLKPKDREMREGSKFDILVEAEDDIKITKMGISFSKNGEAERREDVKFEKIGKEKGKFICKIVTDSLEIEPGESISYYAFALDNRPKPEEGRSDIYFLDMVDYNVTARQGGGMDLSPQANLIKMQKDIIRTTWQLIKLKEANNSKKNNDKIKETGNRQKKIKEVSQKFYEELKLIDFDLAVLLDKAIQEMGSAEEFLAKGKAAEALNPPEKKALGFLIEAFGNLDKNLTKAKGKSKPKEEDKKELDEETKKKMEEALKKLKDLVSDAEEKSDSGELSAAAKEVEDILKEQEKVNEEAAKNQQEQKEKQGKEKEGKEKAERAKSEGEGPGEGEGESSSGGEGKGLAEKQKDLKNEAGEKAEKAAGGGEKLKEASELMDKAAKEYSGENLKEGLKLGLEAEKKLEEAMAGAGKDKGDAGTGEVLRKQKELNGEAAKAAGEQGKQGKGKGEGKGKKGEGAKSGKELSGAQKSVVKKAEGVETENPDAGARLKKAMDLMDRASSEYSRNNVEEGLKLGKQAEGEIKQALNTLNEKDDKKGELAKKAEELLAKLKEIKDAASEMKDSLKDGKKGDKGKDSGESGKGAAEKAARAAAEAEKMRQELEKAAKENSSGSSAGKNTDTKKIKPVEVKIFEDLSRPLVAPKLNQAEIDRFIKELDHVIEKLEGDIIRFYANDIFKNIDKSRVPEKYKKLVELYYEDLAKTKK